MIVEASRGPVGIRPIQEALREHPAMFGGSYAEAEAMPLEEWQGRVQAGLGGARGIIFVAEGGEALVGMTGLIRPESTRLRHAGTLWGVYVRREWRGAGIADALVEACAGWARAAGLRLIRLSVVTENVAAARLYARCGFQVYGVEPEALAHDGAFYDELLMARRISA
jgi:RimJ/RimL family protein N-acetyltransferase